MTDDMAADAGQLQPGGTVAPLCLLARGFTAVGWGVLATAALHGARAFLSCDAIDLRAPAYVLGSLLTGWGVLCLYEYLELSGGDLRPARAAGLMLAAQLYMAPFAVWHRARPLEPFLIGNYNALTVALLMGMLLLNLMSAQLLQRLGACAASRWAAAQSGAILIYGAVLLGLLAQAAGGDVASGAAAGMLAVNRTWGAWGVTAAALGTVLFCRYGRACALARLAEPAPAAAQSPPAEENA